MVGDKGSGYSVEGFEKVGGMKAPARDNRPEEPLAWYWAWLLPLRGRMDSNGAVLPELIYARSARKFQVKSLEGKSILSG